MGLEDTANSPQTMEAPSLLLSAKRSNETYKSTIYEKINMRKERRKCVSRRLSSTPSREGDIICHSRYNCLYLSKQNINGYP